MKTQNNNTQSSIDEVLSNLITAKLQRFLNSPAGGNSLQVYNEIFSTLETVVTNSNINICNESLNYFAQTFYDSVTINGSEGLDPNIFTKKAKLENIDSKNLKYLLILLKGTTFSIPVIQELKRRN